MDLNRALQRENYRLPTTKKVASGLHGKKFSRPLMFPLAFGMLFRMKNVRSVLSVIRRLEDTTGKGMPFGIRSAPEVFQRKIEGSRGLEVIADDFVVVGYGESSHSEIKDHDGNLLPFLEKCDERGVHLNKNKLQLRMKEVPERKSDVPLCLRPYFHLRDDLVVQGDLIFKGRRLVVSPSIRKELISVVHATHIGIKGYSGGPENVFFGLEWRLMSKTMFPNVTCVWLIVPP